MGWERGRYYTRSRRVGGRVVREYVGGGELGALAAQLDAIERERRTDSAHADRALQTQLAEEDAPLADLDRQCELLVRAALLAAGFRRHRRGEWRKPRGRHEEPE
jgi:hypothetical protein